MNKKFKVYFTEKNEIRMGSPFNHCKIVTEGFLISEIGSSGFQDILSWSPEMKYLALVKWEIGIENKPGFKIFILDPTLGKIVHITDRIEGICQSIEFSDDLLKFEIVNNPEKHRIIF